MAIAKIVLSPNPTAANDKKIGWNNIFILLIVCNLSILYMQMLFYLWHLTLNHQQAKCWISNNILHTVGEFLCCLLIFFYFGQKKNSMLHNGNQDFMKSKSMLTPHQWSGSSVVQVMAWCHTDSKASPKTMTTRALIQYKDVVYRKSHCGDKTVIRSSYLHNGNSYIDKMTSLYWLSPQVHKCKEVSSGHNGLTHQK